MSTLWSGRFDAEPDRTAFEFGRSFAVDRRLLEDDIAGSLGWAEAIGRAGVLAPDELREVERALGEILAEAVADPGLATGPDEDVHSFVERRLVERVGDAGRRLHTGRSRNDQVSTDLRLYLRRRIPVLQQGVRALAAALLDQAEAAGDSLMPAYTHLRRAQPVLVAHFLLAHLAALRRDVNRLDDARDEADALPLGSGAIGGSTVPIDTGALAVRLGFSRVVANSLDASSDRDFVSSFLHAAALLMVHLSRLAEDLVVFTTEEFGFFDLSDATSTGSSMMPQKKNPDPLELLRGKSGRVIGRLTGFLATLKGLPSGYNKDLQEDKEAVFDAEDTVLASLQAAKAVVDGLRLDRERTLGAASGLLLATDVADYLAARGLPFRRAHELVGRIVRDLMARGADFAALSPEDWRQYSELFGPDIVAEVTPGASVASKRTPQSTHPAQVARAIVEARSWVASAPLPSFHPAGVPFVPNGGPSPASSSASTRACSFGSAD